MSYVNATESPFKRDEAHFSEATAYFDELAKDGEVPPAKPRGAYMGDLEGQGTRQDNFAHTSTRDPDHRRKTSQITKGPV